MLRRLDLKGSYRSLNKGFWPESHPLGRRAVIYGYNGSGKSTLADLLLEVASGTTPVEVIWEDEDRQTHVVNPGASGPTPSMAVFTKTWVQRNLSSFLDGHNASAIVTLGQEAIEAKGDEAELEVEIAGLTKAAQDADKKMCEAERKVEQLARDVQDAIASQLREFDYQRFSKNRYSLPKVTDELTKYKGEFPDENQYAESLKR